MQHAHFLLIIAFHLGSPLPQPAASQSTAAAAACYGCCCLLWMLLLLLLLLLPAQPSTPAVQLLQLQPTLSILARAASAPSNWASHRKAQMDSSVSLGLTATSSLQAA
jgi:hypothetical protein